MAGDVSVVVHGQDQLLATLAALRRDLEDLSAPGAVAGDALVGHADPPVDTGYLEASWYVSVRGNRVRVGWSAPYASFAEARTRFAARAVASAQGDVAQAYDAGVADLCAHVRGL